MLVEEHRVKLRSDCSILHYRFQFYDGIHVLFTITKKKVMYWWINIDSTRVHMAEFEVEDKKVEDIAWVRTEDSSYLLLIARDSLNRLERGLSKFSKPTDSPSFNWESLEAGFSNYIPVLSYEVLDISQDSGWLLCMSEESNITILNGVYPSETPCPERYVGNGQNNNSSALGCIRNATNNTVAGVLSYIKYEEFGFFELQRTREIGRDSGEDETSRPYSKDYASDRSPEENEENDREIWNQASYQGAWKEADPLLAATQNIAIEVCSGRISVYYFDDIQETPNEEKIVEKKKGTFGCLCGQKFSLTIAEVND